MNVMKPVLLKRKTKCNRIRVFQSANRFLVLLSSTLYLFIVFLYCSMYITPYNKTTTSFKIFLVGCLSMDYWGGFHKRSLLITQLTRKH